MKQALPPLSKQSGEFKFWHVLLIILVVVGVALFINAKGTNFFTRIITDNLSFKTEQNNGNYQADYVEPQVSNATYSPEPEDTDQDVWVSEPNPTQQQRQNPQDQVLQEYNDNLYTDHADNPKPSYSYDEQFPTRLDRGYYTIQLFTGYNSKQAYDLRTALKKDGYTATHIREVRTRKGVLFKVRIGRYKERYTAFAVRDQLRRRYPKTLSTSFVMLVERVYN